MQRDEVDRFCRGIARVQRTCRLVQRSSKPSTIIFCFHEDASTVSFQSNPAREPTAICFFVANIVFLAAQHVFVMLFLVLLLASVSLVSGNHCRVQVLLNKQTTEQSCHHSFFVELGNVTSQAIVHCALRVGMHVHLCACVYALVCVMWLGACYNLTSSDLCSSVLPYKTVYVNDGN